MADLALQDIKDARPYWLQRNLYTDLFTIQPGSRQAVFAIRGWNGSGQSGMWAELTAVGVSQIPRLRLDVSADGLAQQYWADQFEPGLRLVPVGAGAVKSLSLSLTNTGAAAVSNVQLVYLVTFWRMPVDGKVLHGYALTPAELAQARNAGIDTDPNTQHGLLPVPIGTVIERSYSNRRVLPWLSFANVVSNVTTADQVFHQVTVGPNQLAVLLEAEVDANLADGVLLTVDQDSKGAALQLRGDCLRGGQPLFMSAERSLVFHMSAGRAVAGQVPARLKILQASMSTVLRVRMQQLDAAGLAMSLKTTNAQQKAQQIVDRIGSGVS